MRSGSNGCMRFEETHGSAANVGIAFMVEGPQQLVSHRVAQNLNTPNPFSYADLYQFAGVASVALLGGPDMTARFRWGRADAPWLWCQGETQTNMPDVNGGHKEGWHRHGAARITQRLQTTFESLQTYFESTLLMPPQQWVALVGAHTVGRVAGLLEAKVAAVDFDDTPHTFDNEYFKQLKLFADSARTSMCPQTRKPGEAHWFHPKQMPSCWQRFTSNPDGTSTLNVSAGYMVNPNHGGCLNAMLDADVAMTVNADYRFWIQGLRSHPTYKLAATRKPIARSCGASSHIARHAHAVLACACLCLPVRLKHTEYAERQDSFFCNFANAFLATTVLGHADGALLPLSDAPVEPVRCPAYRPPAEPPASPPADPPADPPAGSPMDLPAAAPSEPPVPGTGAGADSSTQSVPPMPPARPAEVSGTNITGITVTVVELSLRASGDVADYTPEVIASVSRTFASAVNVDVSAVTVTVAAASVLLTVSIMAASTTEAAATQSVLGNSVATPEAATVFLADVQGVAIAVEAVVAAPALVTRPLVASPPPPAVGASGSVVGVASAAAAVGACAFAVVVGYLCRRRAHGVNVQAHPPKQPTSLKSGCANLGAATDSSSVTMSA